MKVGWLSDLGDPDPALELLREGLRDLGHVEGKTFVIVARFADGDFSRLPRLVDELAAERIEMLVTRGPSRPERWASRYHLRCCCAPTA